MAGTMDKIKAKVDNVLHKDKTHSDPTGPHSSHAANSADPRVDSDRIGTAGNTAGAGGVGAGQYGSNTTHTGTGLAGSHNTHGTTGSGLTGSHNAHNTGVTGTHGTTHHSDPTGPHDSKLANKLDPRVDSDRVGPAGNTAGAGGYGSNTTHSTTGSGLTGSHNTHGTTGGLTGNTTHGTGHNDPTGPHSSHLANKADPRVDSDRYGAAGNTAGAGGIGAGQYGSNTHTGTTGSGLTGTHGTHNTHGTTGAGLTGTHGTHTGATVGSGNSNTTAGPHNSDMLNKLDPRVDSDLDGSKTVGGNQTYH